MSLACDEIKKIAHLSRLNLTGSEADLFSDQLSNIISLVEQMNKVDTHAIAPMIHPHDVSQPLRVDNVTETDEHQVYQQNAPSVEAGLYLVPKVIDEA